MRYVQESQQNAPIQPRGVFYIRFFTYVLCRKQRAVSYKNMDAGRDGRVVNGGTAIKTVFFIRPEHKQIARHA